MNSDQRSGLREQHIEKILSVLVSYPQIERALLYGSRATGRYNSGSDIDLTLVGPHLTTSDLLRIEIDLDDLLLPYKIDLSLQHQIDNPQLLQHIRDFGVEFYPSSQGGKK